MKIVDDLKKVPVPQWSEERWNKIENEVMSGISRKSPSLVPFPYWKQVGSFAAAAVLIIGFVLFNSFFKTNSEYSSRQFADIYSGLKVKGGTESHGSYTAIDKGVSFLLSETGEVEFVEMTSRAVKIKLHSGRVELKVEKRKNGQIFQVFTNDAVAEVVGTRFRVELIEQEKEVLTRLEVLEGVVKFYPVSEAEKVMLVRAGETAILRSGKIQPPLQAAVEHGSAKVAENAAANEKRHLNLMKHLIEKSTELAIVDTSVAEDNNSLLLSADYVTASARIRTGDYSGALAIINRMLTTSDIKPEERVRLYEDKANIFRKTGDLSAYSDVLAELSRECCDTLSADNQLWEAILVRSRDLSDFGTASKLIKEYLDRFPYGHWREEAALKYAEVRYAMRQIDSAVAGYKLFIASFPTSSFMDRALYHLAHIESHEIGDCLSAAGHYSTIVVSNPASLLAEDATFWYADCMERVGDKKIARDTYEKYLKEYPAGRWAKSARSRIKK